MPEWLAEKMDTMEKKKPENESATATETPAGDGRDEPQAAPALTPAELDDLKARAARADESWDRLLRATADLDNFKKRAAREREEATRYANEALMKRLVPVLDNFDMAMAAAGPAQAEAARSLQVGVAMIHQQFRQALLESGLEEVDATGKAFDPNWHEAVSQQESADHAEGQVLQQLRKGYKLRDRLLRPASVVVAKKPAA